MVTPDLGDGMRAELEQARAAVDELAGQRDELLALLADVTSCLSSFGLAMRAGDRVATSSSWSFLTRAHGAAVAYGTRLCLELGLDPAMPLTYPDDPTPTGDTTA